MEKVRTFQFSPSISLSSVAPLEEEGGQRHLMRGNQDWNPGRVQFPDFAAWIRFLKLLLLQFFSSPRLKKGAYLAPHVISLYKFPIAEEGTRAIMPFDSFEHFWFIIASDMVCLSYSTYPVGDRSRSRPSSSSSAPLFQRDCLCPFLRMRILTYLVALPSERAQSGNKQTVRGRSEQTDLRAGAIPICPNSLLIPGPIHSFHSCILLKRHKYGSNDRVTSKYHTEINPKYTRAAFMYELVSR